MTNNEPRQFFVYRRKDSAGWICRFKDDAGKWRDHRCPPEARTKRDAQIYSRTWLAEMDRLGQRPEAPVTPKPDRGPTLRDLRDKWIALRDADPKLAASTRTADKANLDHHILPELGDLPICDLSVARVRQFVRDFRDAPRVATGKPRSGSTVRNVVGTLSTFVQDCRAEEWVSLPGNPVRDPAVSKLLPEKEQTEPLPLNKQQAERLITGSNIPPQRRIRYATACFTGMRIGEMTPLLWQDLEGLDGDDGFVVINKSQRDGVLGKTKTRTSNRKVPIHSQLAPRLRAWKARGWAEFVGRHPQPGDPVFPDLAGVKQPHAARYLRKDLVGVGCADNVGGELLDFHGCRKAFRTWLDENGVNETLADRIIGHSRGTVAERHYIGRRNLDPWREAIETIRLDLSTGEVIALPVKVAVGAESNDVGGGVVGGPDGQDTGCRTPKLVAGCDKGGCDVEESSNKLDRDSGRRTVTALATPSPRRDEKKRVTDRRTGWGAVYHVCPGSPDVPCPRQP